MNTIRIIWQFILICISVSCVEEENDTVLDINDRAVCMFNSTRTGDSATGWLSDDEVGISVYRSGTDKIYAGLMNRRYRTSGDGTFFPVETEDKIIYPINGDAVDFIAYYPYDPMATDHFYDVDLCDQSDLRSIDLLYSNNAKGVNKYSGNPNLVFRHPLSKLAVKIAPGEGITEEKLYGSVVLLNNVGLQATFDLLDGTFVQRGMTGSVEVPMDGLRGEAIVLPGAAQDAEVTVILADGGIYRTTIPDANFLPGAAHRYRVIVTRTGAEIHPLDIVDWNNDGSESENESIAIVTYNVGDYYPNPTDPETAVGVVYWLSPGSENRSGKALSFDTSEQAWSDAPAQEIQAINIVTGWVNMSAALAVDATLQCFPAFRWCADKGEGWYLPARYELHVMREQWGRNHEVIDRALAAVGGELLSGEDIYLSSSESRGNDPAGDAATYNFSTKEWPPHSKSIPHRIRAVLVF